MPKRSNDSTKSTSIRILNFHRPCGQPELVTSSKGKQRRVYRWYATPWQMLRRLPGVAGYLKPELTIEALDQVARAQSDTAAAETMQAAKQKLFANFHQREKRMKEGPWKCRSDGQRGKPKPRFPRCPQPLEITHNVIPTFPPPRLSAWKTGKPEAGFPLSHLLFVSFSKSNQERRPGGGSLRSRVQAHRWIRKC